MIVPDAPPDEGTWVDTHALHFPVRAPRRSGRFEKGVGNDGYDRGTGVEVPKHPRLRRPGDAGPVADPFSA